jgi:hypothetical protein
MSYEQFFSMSDHDLSLLFHVHPSPAASDRQSVTEPAEVCRLSISCPFPHFCGSFGNTRPRTGRTSLPVSGSPLMYSVYFFASIMS